MPGWEQEDDIVCESCGGLVEPLDDLRQSRWCKCNRFQEMADLRSFGYAPAPEVRSFGGRWALRRPDGTGVWEQSFGREIEKLVST